MNEYFINYSIYILNLNLNKNKKTIKLKNNKYRIVNGFPNNQKNSYSFIKLLRYKIRKIIFYIFLKKKISKRNHKYKYTS